MLLQPHQNQQALDYFEEICNRISGELRVVGHELRSNGDVFVAYTGEHPSDDKLEEWWFNERIEDRNAVGYDPRDSMV